MNTIDATIRNTNTKGQVSSLRIDGNVPAIIYGGTEQNQKISISKKLYVCNKNQIKTQIESFI